MLMGEGVLGLALLALWIYCLLDSITADSQQVRNLPKALWVVLVATIPDLGSVAWLIAGRPRGPVRSGGLPRLGSPRRPTWARPAPAKPGAPDDDPGFLKSLGDLDDQHEALLTSWEADLRRREEELKRRPEPPPEGEGDRPT